jgi:uncharacterized protein (DUF3084 family)
LVNFQIHAGYDPDCGNCNQELVCPSCIHCEECDEKDERIQELEGEVEFKEEEIQDLQMDLDEANELANQKMAE